MALFTGKRVETAGLVIAGLSTGFLLHGGHRIGAAVGLGVYLLDRFYPAAFNFLKNFAEPTTWPGYVGLGVAGLFAAHAGSYEGVAVLVGLLATGDGRMFDVLY